MKRKAWTKEEDEYLIKNYKKTKIKECAAFLNRTIQSVKSHAVVLKITKLPSKKWTKEEHNWIKDNYLKYDINYCSEFLQKTKTAIFQYVFKYFHYKKQEYYTQYELDFIKDNFKKYDAIYCAEKLNRSVYAIYHIAKKLGISREKYEGKSLPKYKIEKHLEKTGIKLLDKYIRGDIKHRFLCTCGKEFYSKPYYVFYGSVVGCGNCKLMRNGIWTSNVALDLHQKLIDYGFPTTEEHHNFKVLNGKYIDIVIPEWKIGIEYDGQHWHKSKKSEDLKRSKELRKLGWKILLIRGNYSIPKISTIAKRIEKLKNGSNYEVITCKDWYQ